MPSMAEVVDVLLVLKSSEVSPVPSPTRLDSDEAELESKSEAVPHTIYPSFSVVSVTVVQRFGSIVFPGPVAVSVGRCFIPVCSRGLLGRKARSRGLRRI
jgi:hypothetical protein